MAEGADVLKIAQKCCFNGKVRTKSYTVQRDTIGSMMSPVELRTRILIASGLATIFIGYFIFSYAADAASGSWISLGVDGILLAIGTFFLFEVIRCAWRLLFGHTQEISRAGRGRESIDFRG
jgi:hypothetical protein